MPADRDEFLRRLRATFRVEAAEHLEALSSALLALEQAAGPERAPLLESAYREVHSLKGAARAVSFAPVEGLCHSLETIFAGWKSGSAAVDLSIFDLLHEALDQIGALIASRETNGSPASVAGLVRRIEESIPRARTVRRAPAEPEVPPPTVPVAPPPPAPGPSASGAETVRVPLARLDSIMQRAEELLAPRFAAAERLNELREVRELVAARQRENATAPAGPAGAAGPGATSRAGDSSPLLARAGAEAAFLSVLEERLEFLERRALADHHALAGTVDSLLHDAKETQMLPFSPVMDALRKLARDLARDRGRQVDLVGKGDDIEIDRRILGEMKAPLHHMVRNAVDHGLEDPAERERKGKPERGVVSVTISHRSGRIEIAVADDGAGIDPGGVRAAAARAGIASEEELSALTGRELLSLIFHSGLSTSPRVTEISGRGLGLAIVREKVERLGGTIAAESEPDRGTTFRINLPLTAATMRGVIVRVGERRFVVPAVGVERVIRVPLAGIATVEARETVHFQDGPIALGWLADALEIDRPASGPEQHAQLVVLGNGTDRVAFRVDEVIAEQEVLVKPLGAQLARVRNVAGASVLGTGAVVPVLSTADLVKSALRASRPVPSASGDAQKRRRRVLIAEDSITSRTLLKSILEAAGYDVTVTVDGIEAWTALRTGPFDLVVSDVEMPRMDGFELTRRIRADSSLSETPVILVTALASREHRERGVEAGANAYIVKGSFDQSDLLKAVRRLS